MSKQIYRKIGGAGTGKTRYILDSLTQAKKELRLSTDEIGFATFTRAGRQEITERAADAWGVSPEALNEHGWFRTAHSMAYRQCEVEQGSLITDDDWLCEAMGAKVGLRLDARGERTYLTAGGGDTTIQQSLAAWELARNLTVPVPQVLARRRRCGDTVPSDGQVRMIIDKYESAKRLAGKLDYTDLLSMFAGVRHHFGGIERVDPVGKPPEELRVLAIDEAQDSSMLVDLVCRRLASSPNMERVWICGDPYQSIHGFAGGDYRLFLGWDAEESTMPRSYRCPSAILELGERCLRRMRTGYRDRGISPASNGGTVRRCHSPTEALRGLTASTSTLILGRCAFALAEYERVLQERGLPFVWVDKHQSTTSSMIAFRALWDLGNGEAVPGENFLHAVKIIPQSVGDEAMFRRGEKAAWAAGRRTQAIDWVFPEDEYLAKAGLEPPLVRLIRQKEWHNIVDKRVRSKAATWMRAAKLGGPEVATNPPIRLSTIHSAKGLEADRVVLSTISSAACENSRVSLPESYDEECRIGYVAVTRARQEFTVVSDAEFHKMELPI